VLCPRALRECRFAPEREKELSRHQLALTVNGERRQAELRPGGGCVVAVVTGTDLLEGVSPLPTNGVLPGMQVPPPR
jgi:hypothetical protein